MTETIDKQVAATADDASLRVGVSFVNDGTTLIVDFATRDYQNWVRFAGITIPSGSIIGANTYLTAIGGATDAGDSALRIYGLKEDDVGDFPDETTTSGYDLTTEYKDWTLGSIVGGTEYDSPSIQAIVQEIVDHMGGLSNEHMGFRIHNTAQGVLKRARTWDYSGNVSGLKLHIEYEPPVAGAQDSKHLVVLDLI